MNEKIRESDRRKQEAISKSNRSTVGKVAGLAALGAVAAYGISKLSEDNKKGGAQRA